MRIYDLGIICPSLRPLLRPPLQAASALGREKKLSDRGEKLMPWLRAEEAAVAAAILSGFCIAFGGLADRRSIYGQGENRSRQ